MDHPDYLVVESDCVWRVNRALVNDTSHTIRGLVIGPNSKQSILNTPELAAGVYEYHCVARLNISGDEVRQYSTVAMVTVRGQ